MFTVKLITKGTEQIFPASQTMFYNSDILPNGEGSPAKFCWYQDDILSWQEIFEGRIYVMNGEGKTVADYML
jgi:hypothetical protein